MSVPSVSSTNANAWAAKVQPGQFEINSKEFGPVAASAIGVAHALGDAASSVCSFSREGLDALGDAAHAVYDGAAQVVDKVEDIAESVGSAVSDAVGSVVDGVESAAGTVAGYVALGIAAGEKLIDEVI